MNTVSNTATVLFSRDIPLPPSVNSKAFACFQKFRITTSDRRVRYVLHSRETNQYTLFSQENTGQPELKAIKREEGYLKYRIKNCEGELFIPYYHNDNVEPDAVLTTFQPIIDDQPDRDIEFRQGFTPLSKQFMLWVPNTLSRPDKKPEALEVVRSSSNEVRHRKIGRNDVKYLQIPDNDHGLKIKFHGDVLKFRFHGREEEVSPPYHQANPVPEHGNETAAPTARLRGFLSDYFGPGHPPDNRFTDPFMSSARGNHDEILL